MGPTSLLVQVNERHDRGHDRRKPRDHDQENEQRASTRRCHPEHSAPPESADEDRVQFIPVGVVGGEPGDAALGDHQCPAVANLAVGKAPVH